MKTKRLYFRSSGMICLCLLMLLVVAIPDPIFALDIYVSVDGGAQADGSLTKPYGSLPDAVDAVRALRKAGNTEPAVIVLRAGRYQLDQTLVLGMEDEYPSDSKDLVLPKYGAGEPSGPSYLTFAAYPGETPVISGGAPVTGWKRLASAPAELPAKAVRKVWIADMPKGMDRFYTLYDTKGRLQRARGDDGFLPTRNGDSKTLHFPEGALKNWDNLEDVEIQVRPGVAYEINMLPLESIDEENGVAKTRVAAAGSMGSLPAYLLEIMGGKAASVWVENVLEELDEPGEWVVNTQTRKIYLWPSDSAADGSPRGILAPTTSELICVEGLIDYDGPTDTPVRGIAFSGLTFSHADRWAWQSNEEVAGWGLQHAWDLFDKPSALLRFRGAEACRVTDCRFVHSGGTGLRLDLHAQRNRITDSEFAHLGEAGILLIGYGLGAKDVNHNNDIVNNYLHHFSEITWQSPGFWAWQSGHNRIAHNEFSHSGYCSVVISTRSAGSKTRPEGVRAQEDEERGRGGNRRQGGYAGWKLREKQMHSRHNLFEYNEISHAVQLLSDGNGVYVSGTGTGNIIRYNYLHDNLSHSLPAAIRCDDDQHETLIYGNVLYNNSGHAAAIASKGVNDIINNFIVAPTKVPRNGYISFEWAPVTGSKVQRNIIISHPDGGKAQSERLRKGQTSAGPKLESTDMDKNLYYHPTDSHWMDDHLLKMRAVGKEKASLVVDPLFADPAGGDFSFRPGSPALTLGIEPLDVSKMGRLDGASQAPDHYPSFSWDTIPLYMHMQKSAAFTPEELKYLAGFPIITLEKTTGSSAYGSSEAGSREAAKAIKAINPAAKVLYYRNVMCNYGSYQVNEGLGNIPGAFLVGRNGNTRLHRGKREVYDLSNPALRKWWVDHCVEMAGYKEIDGIFLDGNIKALEPEFLGEEIGLERKQEVAEGYTVMMQDIKDRAPSDKLLVANIIRARLPNSGLDYMQYFDGSYLEGIEAGANGIPRLEYLARGIAAVQQAAREGKIIGMSMGLGNSAVRGLAIDDSRQSLRPGANTRPRLEYCLALFLICAEKYSYVYPHDGYSVNNNDSAVWLKRFPEYDKPLGPPKGPAIQDGYKYTREFESASVFLDIEANEAKIVWK